MILFLIGASVLFTNNQLAYADYLGGKYQHVPGSITYLNYNYPLNRYGRNVQQAAVNWRNVANYVKPRQVANNVKIGVVDYHDNHNFYAYVSHNPGSAGPIYQTSVVWLNQRLMDPLNDFNRTYVTTHEFGHALGLAHTTSTSQDSIMKPGGGGFTFPWYNTPMSYDRGQINNLYN